MTRLGLVIQGPLVSEGRSGATRTGRRHEFVESDVVTLDCTETVSRSLDAAEELFDESLCVTWTDDDATELIARHGTARVVQIPNPGADRPAREGPIAGNNWNRQFISTLHGLRELKKRGCDVAVKIRTDQSLPLDRLAESVRQAPRTQLLVPGMNRSDPTKLPDFYFGGDIDRLIRASEAFLACETTPGTIHSDLFFSWCRELADSRRLRLACSPRWRGTPLQRQLVRYAWTELMTPLPEDIFASTKWRGEEMAPDRVAVYLFAEAGRAERERVIDRQMPTSPRTWARSIKRGLPSAKAVTGALTGRAGASKATRGPDFIGVGSSRCGTTSLYEAFRRHPDVWLPPIKELHYWDLERDGDLLTRKGAEGRLTRIRFGVNRARQRSTRRDGDVRFMTRFITGRRTDGWYTQLFTAPVGTTGEITPGYCALSLPEIRHVESVVPDARIVIMLRDPIERVWSNAVKVLIRDPGRPESSVTDAMLAEYLDRPAVRTRCDYLNIVRSWSEVFGRDRVFVGFLEDMEQHPEAFAQGLCSFLGVTPEPLVAALRTLPVANATRSSKDTFPPALERQLAERFLPMVDDLAAEVDGVPPQWRERIVAVLDR